MMLSNLLLIVLMIAVAFAAPLKAGIDLSVASYQVSQATANQIPSANSTVSPSRDLNTTTSRSPGSIFSSLTSMFPISLPPDTLNSTLLPPPPTSLSSPKLSPSSVSASTSSESAPAGNSFPVFSTISIAASSTSTPVTVSSSPPAPASSVAASSTTPAATSSSTTMISVATSPLTITETETKTFFGTNTRNASCKHPQFTNPGGSRPTTLQTSIKINCSSISSASGPHRTGGPCLKNTEKWRLAHTNNPQGSENSSAINQLWSNDFLVDITVSGGNFKGGKPFSSSGTYHGNCTNGVLDTAMASMDVHELCGRDLMCLAGVLMTSLGSVITEIMNPTPKETVPLWCSKGMGGTNSSKKTSGSGMPWFALETGKWNTVRASGTMIATPGALSNTQIQPTGILGILESLPTTLKPLPSSLSPMVIQTAASTETRSMVTDSGLPTLSQRSVRITTSGNAVFGNSVSPLASVLSSGSTSVAATASKKPTGDSRQDEWSEWRTVRPMPIITKHAVLTTTKSADGITSWATISQRAATSLGTSNCIKSSHPHNTTALNELSAWLETFDLVQGAVPTITESVNSGYTPSITQRQLITTTVYNGYTTATYDYWMLSPFTWSVNSVQVSEALTLLSTRFPTPTRTA